MVNENIATIFYKGLTPVGRDFNFIQRVFASLKFHSLIEIPNQQR